MAPGGGLGAAGPGGCGGVGSGWRVPAALLWLPAVRQRHRKVKWSLFPPKEKQFLRAAAVTCFCWGYVGQEIPRNFSGAMRVRRTGSVCWAEPSLSPSTQLSQNLGKSLERFQQQLEGETLKSEATKWAFIPKAFGVALVGGRISQESWHGSGCETGESVPSPGQQGRGGRMPSFCRGRRKHAGNPQEELGRARCSWLEHPSKTLLVV